MEALGIAAVPYLEKQQFSSRDLVKFLEAYKKAGGRDESWEKIVSSQCERNYKLPGINLDVALRMQVPDLQDGLQAGMGMMVWGSSLVLADFLSRYTNLAQ